MKGETRCDDFLEFKLQHRCSDVMDTICTSLGCKEELEEKVEEFNKDKRKKK